MESYDSNRTTRTTSEGSETVSTAEGGGTNDAGIGGRGKLVG